MRLSIGLPLLSFAVSLVSAEHLGARKHHVSSRSARSTNASSLFLAERDGNSRFTYYQDGLGACGKTNTPSDFIVALNSAQFDGGSHCFETITITVGGKTGQAQIMDECPGCPYGGLDFSEGLFDYFGSESEGVLYGAWDFGSGAATPKTSSAQPVISVAIKTSYKPKPTTSSTPPPPPPTTTSTWVAPSTTSTSTHSSTTSTSTTHSKSKHSSTPAPTSTSSSSSSSSIPPQTSTTSSAAPVIETEGTIPTVKSANSFIYSFTNAFVGLSGLLIDSQIA